MASLPSCVFVVNNPLCIQPLAIPCTEKVACSVASLPSCVFVINNPLCVQPLAIPCTGKKACSVASPPGPQPLGRLR